MLLLMSARIWLVLLLAGMHLLAAPMLARGTPAAAETASPARPPLNPVLARAPSPYLRHHAADAVRWRRWGADALQEAARRGVPVFLSVGYLSCYWCGVMQRESFTNAEVAAWLERHFVPVLVDREARPALDAMYLEAARLLRKGVAGWPNNVFLTPEGEPFDAVGYLPRATFMAKLREVAAAWRRDARSLRQKARTTAAQVQRLLQHAGAGKAALAQLGNARIRQLAAGLAGRFDPFFGGLDRLPKHLRAPLLMLLGRVALVHRSDEARKALLRSLRMMSQGAVFDHLQGGFFRYATDAAWHVPHFEKMLSDQALMADALLLGWRISGDAWLRQAAQRTLDFALQHLQLPHGGFATALSAFDDAGREGGFYLFTPAELQGLLGAEDAAWALEKFGQLSDGELAGHVVVQVQDVALDDGGERARLQRVLRGLRAALHQRTPHARDDKVISGWNGMMIGALARAAQYWPQQAPRYRAAAQRAAHFVLQRLMVVNAEGTGRGAGVNTNAGADFPAARLARHWLDGAAHGAATLEDLAHVVDGLLALHDLDAGGNWLQAAERLMLLAKERFLDADSGRWWHTAERVGFMRMAPPPDGALPAADAVMALNMLRLAARTGREQWRRLAEQALAAQLKALLKGDELDPGRATWLRAADVALNGEDDMPRHAARGRVRAWAQWLPASEQDTTTHPLPAASSGATVADGSAREQGEGGPVLRRVLRVRVQVAKGWHVQADKPDDPSLIPTQLTVLWPQGARLVPRYPPAVRKRLGFSAAPLKLLDGGFDIDAALHLPSAAQVHSAPVVLQLQVQACSNTICLPPEQLALFLSPPGR